MNGRLYDPVLGRMLSADNFAQNPSSSQSFNRYSYCVNNPLRYTDPSGELIGWDDAIVAGVGFVVGFAEYAITHSNQKGWGWKALAAGGVDAAIAEGCYLTMGGGLAATSGAIGAGAGGAGSMGAALSFSSSFALGSASNFAEHYQQISNAGSWSAVGLIGGYGLGAGINAGLSNTYMSSDNTYTGAGAHIDDELFGVGSDFSAAKPSLMSGVIANALASGLNSGISSFFESVYRPDNNSWMLKNVDWNNIGKQTIKSAFSSAIGQMFGNKYLSSNTPLNNCYALNLRKDAGEMLSSLAVASSYYYNDVSQFSLFGIKGYDVIGFLSSFLK